MSSIVQKPQVEFILLLDHQEILEKYDVLPVT